MGLPTVDELVVFCQGPNIVPRKMRWLSQMTPTPTVVAFSSFLAPSSDTLRRGSEGGCRAREARGVPVLQRGTEAAASGPSPRVGQQPAVHPAFPTALNIVGVPSQ